MISTSKASITQKEEGVNQGDIFRNVKYAFVDDEDEESVEILEYIFPYAIVISQSCDVAFMNDFLEADNKKPVKFMPSILMCPIYPKDVIVHGEHLKEVFEDMNIALEKGSPYYNKDDVKVTEKDQHVRFHGLKVVVQVDGNAKTLIDNAVIDFKHVFSVPMKYLRKSRSNRICTLGDIYVDQIVNKFSAYLARIGLPDPKIT